MAVRFTTFIAASALVLVAAAPVHADRTHLVDGHMTPLLGELLPHPLHLTGSCSGVAVTEWDVTVAGSQRTAKATKLLDKWCRRAVAEFPVFLGKRGLKAHPLPRLRWHLALLSDGHCYRCLNDRKWRFDGRYPLGDLWGYTNFREQYAYITNQVFLDGKPRAVWVQSVVHESWHECSYASGLWQTLGRDDWEREQQDEELAEKFTRYVLGR